MSLEIEEKPAKDHNQLGVIATAMIYASLPHSEIEGAVFKRRNGDLSHDPERPGHRPPLRKDATPYHGVPLHRSQTDEGTRDLLGALENEFAKKLGLGTGGGPRGDLTRLTEQAKRLFTSHITLIGAPDSQFHWRNVNLTDSGMLLWNPHDPDAKSPWKAN
ncbi:replication protein RepA [Aeromonas veronii]|uniref:replication protein RepA n=1 Tax=Aeromonas veronii TaxID=654 RepID=UPI001F0ADAB3|nr:replication protein RepA [Aeromonas veronii]